MFDQKLTSEWLNSLVGEWSLDFATAESSEHPGFRATGTESIRPIGEGIVIESVSTGADGSSSRSITLICSHAEKARITGAVMSTAVDTIFNSVGEIGQDGRSLTLETEGPAMTPGRETDRYRDVFVIEDERSRYTAAELLHDDGSWRAFMRTVYRRKS
jgi:Protein of unknown function (DUF1579)